MIEWLKSLDSVQVCGLPVFKNGAFFTQTLFAVMSSVACSCQVCDFLVIEHDKEVDALRDEIKRELGNKPIISAQDSTYASCLSEIEKWLSDIDSHVAHAVTNSRVWAVCFALVALVLLATDLAKYVGFLPLLLFLFLAEIRRKLVSRVRPLYSKAKEKGEYFRGSRNAYNARGNEVDYKADSKVEEAIKELTKAIGALPKKSPSRKKTANGSAGSKKKPSAPQPSDGTPDNK